MNMKRLGRNIPLAALMLTAALIAGCGGGGLSGTYESNYGVMSIKFDSGKAYVTSLGGTIQTAYETHDDKVILKGPQGNLVLTRNKDGSLEGPMGALRKKGG